MTYRGLCDLGAEKLKRAGIREAELDARLLLEHICSTNRNDLLVHGDREVDCGRETAYRKLLEERSRHVPLQHLTGVQNFMGLDFAVDGNVLIPRQDTEILAEEVLKNLHDGMNVLDLCTGSGCILISLLHYSNNCRGTGADISPEALAVAEKNAGALLGGRIGMRRPGEDENECSDAKGAVRFIRSDLFEQIEGKFDLIVSNPPYIPGGAIEGLMPEVRDYEPVQALDGGRDGLDFYRRITAGAGAHLFGGGMLFFEIGCDQAAEVCGFMESSGFLEVHVVKDYAGLDRVVYGTLGHGKNGVES